MPVSETSGSQERQGRAADCASPAPRDWDVCTHAHTYMFSSLALVLRNENKRKVVRLAGPDGPLVTRPRVYDGTMMRTPPSA